MQKMILAILALAAIAAPAFAKTPSKYYLSGVVSCDTQVVIEPNLGFCRSISGNSPGGILYAIDVTKKDRPVVRQDYDIPVDPIAHMKILELSDLGRKNGWPQCANLLVENGTITWLWDRPLSDCLKDDVIKPIEE